MNNEVHLETLAAAYPRRPTHLDEPLCLDFVDTVDTHDGDSYYDDLSSYRDLVLWGHLAGLLDDRHAERLLVEAERRPEEAAATHHRALALRESLYRLFSAAVHGVEFPAEDLAVLNAELALAFSKTELAAGSDRLAWTWTVREHALDYPLWPVVRTAAELLTSSELGRIGECASDTCQWLFLDVSKNRSRRYCGEGCSNRTRARRFREQRRAETSR